MQGWGIRDLKRRCQERRELLAQYPHLASEQELTDYWPGGKENTLKGVGAWIYCYAQYSAFWRRSERQGDPNDPTHQNEAEREAAQRAAMDAFRDKPVTVELLFPIEGKVSVQAHPKSHPVLTFIDTLNDDLIYIADRVERDKKLWSAESVLRLGTYKQRFSMHQLTICWILLHPGCDAPFDIYGELPERFPPHINALTEPDIINLCVAHDTLHRKRPDLICLWLRTESKGAQASWATISAGAAKAQGVTVEDLLRRRSFTAWLSQAMVTWKDEHEAVEKAKAESRRPGKPAHVPVTEMI